MKRPEKTFEAFGVIVVPFPFVEMDLAKRRPALVVSSAAFNRRHSCLVFAMITASERSRWPTDGPVTEPHVAGLHKKCVVRMKLFTIDLALVLRLVGRLSARDLQAARLAVRQVFA
jgi:mRNA interferase MazF